MVGPKRSSSTPKWKYSAELIAACNCDWGCPCNFNQTPTKGFCSGLYGGNITSGACGEVKLQGLKWATAGKWPGAIHEGRGTVKIWIDEKASSEQRNCLEAILKGAYGGKPWGIFRPTIDTWLELSYVAFEWKFDGIRSSFRAGDEVRADLDSMKNPVTGAEASAQIILPDGLVCKQLNAVATRTFSVFTKGLKFAAPGKYGFYTTVDHGN